MKRNKLITTLVYKHEQQKIKVKHKSKEESCNHKITPRCIIEEETEELGEKPLYCPPNGESIY